MSTRKPLPKGHIGTWGRYNKGCRCDGCVGAAAVYKKRWYDEHREQENARGRAYRARQKASAA